MTQQEEFLLTDEQLMKIEEEVSRWQDFLNLVIGLLAFTIAIGIISLRAQELWALISFVFLSVLILLNRIKWPPSIAALRRKKNRSKREQIIYDGLMKEFFGWKATVVNFPIYWFGMLMILFVLLGGARWVEKTCGG